MKDRTAIDALTTGPEEHPTPALIPAAAMMRLALCGPVGVLLATLACSSSEPAKEPDDPAKAVYAAPGGWSGGDGTKERARTT